MAARYFRPTSLTWWAGLGSVLTGVAVGVSPESFLLTETGRLITMLAGGHDASPASLVFMGLGLIGVRDYLERAYGKQEDTT
jgi:hypothetical protein